MKDMRQMAAALLLVCLALPMAYGQESPQSPPPPAQFTPGSWSLVLLPDTQYYSDKFPGLFTLQTHWIAKHKDKLNIQYVIQLGDIVETGGDRRHWRNAAEAMSELDGRVPYAMVPGNHDYVDLHKRLTYLDEYFPLAKRKTLPGFGGAMADDLCNSFHLFSAGGTDWIIVALEWAPRDETIAWANEVLEKHRSRRAIVATHAYMSADGTRYDYAKKGKSQGCPPGEFALKSPGNDGEQLWQKLIRKHNVALVVCGHTGDGRGFLSSKNDCGRIVHQMLVDYQGRKLGGEGYLRILEFLPDGKTVQATSYSPLYDHHLTEPGHQFRFELD
jgi:Icc-related predicted phosphoesterase